MADNRAYVYNRLRKELGLTAQQAAGVVGGLGGESGKHLDPNAVNPSSGALGIGQWLGGRMRGVRKGDIRQQTSHLISELKGPERGALTKLLNTNSIADATSVFVRDFERPSPSEISSSINARLGYARDAFNTLGSGSGGPRSSGGARATAASAGGFNTVKTTETTPGVDNSAERRQLVLNFLGNKNADVLDFATQAKALADIPATSTTKTEKFPIANGTATPTSGDITAAGGDLASVAASRASAIDKQRLPYQWGGGHGGKTALHDAVPLDCSGAVSKVLGINPRVSGEFGKWGRPGDGGSRGVTVYSNGHHVLMKINGHFFGTSATNPGGGAGWIPQDAISPQYLQGFTARHSNQ